MDMNQTTGRIEAMIGAVTDAIANTLEASAEQITLATEVARIRQRMAAFSAVLEAVGAQKAELIERLSTSDHATQALYRRQIEMLTAQEVGILKRAGIDDGTASSAVASVDALPAAADPDTVTVSAHKRKKPARA